MWRLGAGKEETANQTELDEKEKNRSDGVVLLYALCFEQNVIPSDDVKDRADPPYKRSFSELLFLSS